MREVLIIEAHTKTRSPTRLASARFHVDERSAISSAKSHPRTSLCSQFASQKVIDFIAKNTAAADRELDFSDVKSGGAKG
jgi:hypothetical protein